MATKNTWVDAHVYLVAIWPVNRHGHQTTLLSWSYGKMLDQTRNFLLLNKNYILYFLASQLVEIDWDKGQISKLCSTVNKKPPQKHPDYIICANVE